MVKSQADSPIHSSDVTIDSVDAFVHLVLDAVPDQSRRKRWTAIVEWYESARAEPCRYPVRLPTGEHLLVQVADAVDDAVSDAFAVITGRIVTKVASLADAADSIAVGRADSWLVLVPATDLHSADALRLARLADRCEADVGLLTGFDAHGVAFGLVKTVLAWQSTRRSSSSVDRLRGGVDGRLDTPSLDDLRLLAVAAHGEPGHLNLRSNILCGAVHSAARLAALGYEAERCCATGSFCRRATETVTPIYVDEVRAEVLHIAGCNGFGVTDGVDLLDASIILAAAEGHVAAVAATPGRGAHISKAAAAIVAAATGADDIRLGQLARRTDQTRPLLGLIPAQVVHGDSLLPLRLSAEQVHAAERRATFVKPSATSHRPAAEHQPTRPTFEAVEAWLKQAEGVLSHAALFEDGIGAAIRLHNPVHEERRTALRAHRERGYAAMLRASACAVSMSASPYQDSILRAFTAAKSRFAQVAAEYESTLVELLQRWWLPSGEGVEHALRRYHLPMTRIESSEHCGHCGYKLDVVMFRARHLSTGRNWMFCEICGWTASVQTWQVLATMVAPKGRMAPGSSLQLTFSSPRSRPARQLKARGTAVVCLEAKGEPLSSTIVASIDGQIPPISLSVPISANARPGSYRVRAMVVDGFDIAFFRTLTAVS